MSFLDILTAQLTEPFRIGLLVALVLTAANTAKTMGVAVPLLLGLVFVAVLIPMSLGRDGGEPMMSIAVGLVSNAIILAVILAAQALYFKLTRREG